MERDKQFKSFIVKSNEVLEEVANQMKGFQNLAEILVAQIKAMEERQNKDNNRLTKKVR